MFAVIGAMAEFERELIRERIQAGLRRARAQGKRVGRPPRVFHRDRVLVLQQTRKSVQAIARELGVSRRTVQRVLSVGQDPRPESCPPTPPPLTQCHAAPALPWLEHA